MAINGTWVKYCSIIGIDWVSLLLDLLLDFSRNDIELSNTKYVAFSNFVKKNLDNLWPV